MLTVPSFQEQPAALLGILQSYVGSDAESPLDVMGRQDAERAAEFVSGDAVQRCRTQPIWVAWHGSWHEMTSTMVAW